MRQAIVDSALEAYRKVSLTGRGQVIFLAGQAGAGRTSTLKALVGACESETPRPLLVTAGFEEEGSISLWQHGPAVNEWLPKVMNLLGQALGPTAGLIDGRAFVKAAAIIGQLLEAGSVSWESLTLVFGENRSLAGSLESLLREAARKGPVVCVLDDYDKAQGRWCADLLRVLSREIERELPILLVASTDGPAELNTNLSVTEQLSAPDSLNVARNLVKQGFAQWWPLKPLSLTRMTEQLDDVGTGLAARLHAASGGNPGLAEELWEVCLKEEIVYFNEPAGRWSLLPDGEERLKLNSLIDKRLRHLLGPEELHRLDEVRHILAYAALEGRRFTADAVAESIGWDRDDLIDFFDAHLLGEGERQGLLSEGPSVPIADGFHETRHVWTYTFTSNWYLRALIDYGLSTAERAKAVLTLAGSLERVYAPSEHLVARALADLYRAAGDAARAAQYQRMAEFGQARDLLYQEAKAILEMARDEWSAWDYAWFTLTLLNALEGNEQRIPQSEYLLISQAACDMAYHTGNFDFIANSLYMHAGGYRKMRDYERAARLYEESRSYSEKAHHPRGVAKAIMKLGSLDVLQGQFDAGREKLTAALNMHREIKSLKGEADCLYGLAMLERSLIEKGKAAPDFSAVRSMQREDYESVVEKLGQALELYRTIHDSRGEFNVRRALARIDHLVGDQEQAREGFDELLAAARQVGLRAHEAYCYKWLAMVETRVPNYEAATSSAVQSLAIYQELEDFQGVADAYQALGMIFINRYSAHGGSTELLMHALKLSTLGATTLKENNLPVPDHCIILMGTLCAALDFGADDNAKLLSDILQAYQTDRGAGLLERALR